MGLLIRKKFITVLTYTMVLIGGMAGVLLALFVPQFYFNWYPILPITYWILGLILVLVLEHNKSTNAHRILNIYMVLRGLKILLTFLIAIIYTFLVNEKEVPFLICLLIYYFTYLGLETWIFYLYEKEMKQRSKYL